MKCSSVCCMGAIESYVTLVFFFFGGVVAVLFRFCSPCQARCLIGRPIADDASAEITFMTEKMFPLKDFERAVSGGNATGLGPSLRCAVEAGAKRPAGALVTETPAKVKAPRWTVTP